MSALSPLTAATSGSSRASAELTQNFDTFLQLLTTQLRNQDPLNPMDPTEFVSQLTQFSELEQSVNQSGTLEDIKGLLGGAQSFAEVNLLGQSVETEVSTIRFDGTPAAFSLSVDGPAEGARLEMVDADGNVVRSIDLSADLVGVPLGWDGMTDDGGVAAAGTYTAQIVRGVGENVRPTGRVYASGVVSEIRMSSAGNVVVLEDGQTVPVDQIRAVR